jgi:hypothetical protein
LHNKVGRFIVAKTGLLRNNKEEDSSLETEEVHDISPRGRSIYTFDYRNTGCNTYSLSKGTWIATIDG